MREAFFLFVPGAGAPSSHPWMQHWKQRLSTIGDVELFDYPYMREGRRRPDPLPLLIAAHRDALVEARRGRTAILIGKSMGGRIGCHVSLEEKVEGVVCFGYPLCGGGDRAKLRDKVLRALQTPILCPMHAHRFVRDLSKHSRRNEGAPFPTSYRARSFTAGSKRHWQPQRNQYVFDHRILDAIAKFCDRYRGKKPRNGPMLGHIRRRGLSIERLVLGASSFYVTMRNILLYAYTRPFPALGRVQIIATVPLRSDGLCRKPQRSDTEPSPPR